MADKFKRLLSAFIATVISLTAINIMVTPIAAETIGDIIMAGDISVSNGTSYPWAKADYNGLTVAKPGNSGVNSSNSVMTFSVTGQGVMSFGCYTSTEKNYDKLVVSLDGTVVHTLSGVNEWQKLNVEVTTDGSHTITVAYTKDSSVNGNDDTCYVGDVSYCIYAPESDFTFDSSTGKITGYTGSTKEVVIPSNIGGIAVTGIGYAAFKSMSNIKSVVIPSGVTSIGNYAFDNCSSLTSVTIPSGVTSIGYDAFSECSSLTDITIPSSVTKIVSHAFRYCRSLTDISVSDDNSDYKSLDGVLYNKEMTTLIVYPAGKKGKFEIPSGVTSIGNSAFCYCDSLTSVTIPSSVTSIGNYAFEICSSLTSVTIPSSVTSIGRSAFVACRSLTSVTILSGVTSIGDYAFDTCSNLTSVTIPSSVTSIGSSAFRKCSSLISVTIPSSVTSIGSDVFNYVENATIYCEKGSTADDASLYPSSCTIKYISDESDFTFDSSTGTITKYVGSDTDVVIPSTIDGVTVKHIGSDTIGSSSDGVFANSNITSVIIPDDVESIGKSTFYNCTNLTSVNIPDSITSIESRTFCNCGSLTSIILPEALTSIGNSAFLGCSSLTNITIPANVTSIGDYAFSSCSSLTCINIENVLDIGRYAFISCSSLEKITISDSIFYNAEERDCFFENCTSLKTVNIKGDGEIKTNLTIWVKYIFSGCTNLEAFNVDDNNVNLTDIDGILYTKDLKNLIICPRAKSGAIDICDGTETINNSAFKDCTSITSVNIPESVKNISSNAFYNCTSLKDINLPKNLESLGNSVFVHTNIESFVVPGTLKEFEINGMANELGPFAYCENLKQIEFEEGFEHLTDIFTHCNKLESITIPKSVISIDSGVFASCSEDLVIKCYKNSTAHTFAEENGVNYELLDTEYILTYDANGGSGEPSSQRGYSGDTIEISNDEPVRSGYKFLGWATSSKASDVEYSSGCSITLSSDITLYAVWEKESTMTLPDVSPSNVTNITSTSARLNAIIESTGGSSILSRKFTYFEKNNMGSVYEVDANESFSADISNLKPDTEYWFYAAANNIVGYGNSVYNAFKTLSSDKEVPISIDVTPDNATLRTGATLKLATRVLPTGAANKNIVWTSSDESIAEIDANGVITGISDGKAVITATTEVGRLKASCNVTVSDAVTELDFSEWNMYAQTRSTGENGYNVDFSKGGTIQFASAYLSRWNGPVSEEDDPYPSTSSSTKVNNITSKYHPQEILYIPNRTSDTDNDNIKNAIMNYGGVVTAMYYQSQYLNNGVSYYMPSNIGSTNGGHQILIVGWDDNYSKANFKATPAGDGAFICKNSYGTDYGEDGYFYVSYYDKGIGRKGSIGNAVYMPPETNDNYNKKYEYDPLGPIATSTYNGSNSVYMANVFPQGGLASAETLKAVSFYTYYMATSYDIYIVTDYQNKYSLTKLSEPIASGVEEYAGYHTVKIGDIALSAGSRFAVVVKLSKPDNNAKAYIEYPCSDLYANAAANSDESYYSTAGGIWTDLTDVTANANFCIKAFTNVNNTNSLNALNGVSLASAVETAEDNDRPYTVEESLELGLELSDEFIAYAQSPVGLQASDTNEFEEIPDSIEIGEADVDYLDGTAYPQKYDLRDFGYVTSVKDQGNYNSCWAFAACASIESTSVKKMLTSMEGSSDLDGDAGDVLLNDISVTSISLDNASVIMPVGEIKQLICTVNPSSATNTDVIWQSSDSDVVCVDTGGNITAKKAGSAKITATSVDGGKMAQCTVLVMAGETVTGVSFNSESISCKAGKVMLLDYTVSPANADNKNVSWSSNNTDVVTVNENGLVKAIAPGTAVIEITTIDGAKTAYCTVTVDDNFDCSISQSSNTLKVVGGSYIFGNISLNTVNKTNNEQTAVAILSFYDMDGKLVNTQTRDVTVQSGEGSISISDIIIENVSSTDLTYKIMLWSDMDKMKPLSAEITGSL